MEIDQSCLEERRREHITRMRVERRSFQASIRVRGGARYAVVVHFPPRLIHFLVELTWFKPDLFEAQLDPTGRVVFRRRPDS